MNKREIILDFTSLLDVVMLILFFFILFSNFETNKIQTALEEQKTLLSEQQANLQAEYEKLNADIQIKINETNDAYKQASDYLEEIKLADERAAENVEGINEFGSGKSLKIKLKMSTNDWKLDLYHKDKLISEIQNSEINTMETEFLNILSEKGYSENDTILCEFIYDATESGTASAYKNTHKLFEQIKMEYKHFFYSETDISIFEED